VQGENQHKEHTLGKVFDKFWGDLEDKVTQTMKSVEPQVRAKRSAEDMLYELLEITRNIARTLPQTSQPLGAYPYPAPEQFVNEYYNPLQSWQMPPSPELNSMSDKAANPAVQTRMDTLPLSEATLARLKKLHIETLAELVDNASAMKNLPANMWTEIIAALAPRGFTFKRGGAGT
jgi:hypothetical protein